MSSDYDRVFVSRHYRQEYRDLANRRRPNHRRDERKAVQNSSTPHPSGLNRRQRRALEADFLKRLEEKSLKIKSKASRQKLLSSERSASKKRPGKKGAKKLRDIGTQYFESDIAVPDKISRNKRRRLNQRHRLKKQRDSTQNNETENCQNASGETGEGTASVPETPTISIVSEEASHQMEVETVEETVKKPKRKVVLKAVSFDNSKTIEPMTFGSMNYAEALKTLKPTKRASVFNRLG